MKYSKYFRGILNNQGQVNINAENTIKMNDINMCEGVIFGLNIAKERYKNTKLHYQFDVKIADMYNKLKKLTNNISPNELLKEMVNNSKD